jgi:O-antigen/teichoic acid export membrane protein
MAVSRNSRVANGFRRALRPDLTFVLAFSGRIITAAAGLLMTFIVATHFPKVEQGFFYAFVSLLGLQVFVELGLGQVIVQFAAHEFAFLSFDRHKGFDGDADALSRLSSLARLASLWFGAGGVGLMLVLAVAGQVIFGHATSVSWQAPWLALCATTALNLALMPAQFLLEGCNQMRNAYFLRAIQNLCNQLGVCTAILFGAGLWSSAVGAAAMATCTLLFIIGRSWRFYGTLSRRPRSSVIHWRAELWPMQWRIGISSISGYFAYSVVTPLAFRLVGPIPAGQLGMSMTLISALSAVASLPVALKVPAMGMAIAQKNFAQLDHMVVRATLKNCGLWLCGASALAGGIFLLSFYHLPIATRVLPLGIFWLWLLASAQSPCAGVPIAAYMRAHKIEPFAGVGVLYALGTFVLYLLFGKLWGITGMGVAQLISLAIMTPVIFTIMQRYRRQNH